MKKIHCSISLYLFSTLSIFGMRQDSPSQTLLYDKPALSKAIMEEALPIGNGFFGGMVFGGVEQEKIQLNIDSLWTGDEKETGSYQNLGALNIKFDSLNGESYKNYTRKLSIDKAVHEVRFDVAGQEYKRAYFASHPDGVMVLKFSSEQAMSGSVMLEDDASSSKYKTASGVSAKDAGKQEDKKKKSKKKGRKRSLYPTRLSSEISAVKDSLILQGTLVNGMKYVSILKVRMNSGSLEIKGNELHFKNTTDFEILLTGKTDYKLSLAENWKGADPMVSANKIIEEASEKTFPELLQDHIQDYQALYNRMEIDLGESPSKVSSQTTDKRLESFQKSFGNGSVQDIDLQELIANYGRYLMISCSREGTMPANLQGLWNWSNSPAWRCDYHSNINVQMNYWMVEQANLSETHLPFADYIMAMRDIQLKNTPKNVKHPSGEAAKRGWSIKTENGVFGGHGFKWNHPGVAWYALHLWEHYAFTEDRNFLKETAYPVLKETCEFWEDRLKQRADGTYVVPDGWSPEHGPTEDGVTYDQEVVYDLFTNYIEASKVLGMDHDYRQKIVMIQSNLLKLKVGKWGQLQEWETDRDDEKDQHRHVNHLFALHPGRQISPLTTPALAEAAKVSLNARGDGGTGWSKAWKISFWARFHDGNRAEKLLNEQISKNFYSNLFDFHPPFQIDGNFGNTAGLHEMLLQSHMREENQQDGELGAPIIHLLPALPDSWPNGYVKGMRARGNLGVDISWKEGQLSSAKIHGPAGKPVILYYEGIKKSMIIPENGELLFSNLK